MRIAWIATVTLYWIAMAAAFAQTPINFSLATAGPHHVVQGHNLFFNVVGTVTAGVDESATPTIAGLPTGATSAFPKQTRAGGCCGATVYSITGNNPVLIATAATTPPGAYPLTIAYTSKSGLTRSIVHVLLVDPVPAPQPKAAFPPDVPLAGLTQWQQNMVKFAKLYCTNPPGGPAYEQAVWYYDATRNYLQIADYTHDEQWLQCARDLDAAYRLYVLNSAGNIPGWHVFPQGVAMSIQREGVLSDAGQADQAALKLLSGNYATFAAVEYVIDWSLSRELSYATEAMLIAEELGQTRGANFSNVVDVLFGHFDQWFQTGSATYTQPFMVSLACEALIKLWNATHDPRVLPMIELAADKLWTKAWDPASLSFRYYNPDGTSAAAPDLNLLIVPIFGWLYQQTGLQVYRDRGDVIFNSGVANGYEGDGKHFTQQYRWSGKYVEWRNAPPVPLPPPPDVLCKPVTPPTAPKPSWTCSF